jgi:two-component system, OmpR family, response regulator
VEALELTGKVEVTEAGRISAIIRGAALQAASVQPTASASRPAHGGPPAPALPEVPGEGALHDNLPELVTAFWLTQQTGELAVQRGKVRKVICFERGRPCQSMSNLVADRFGPFLVRVGKITAAQQQLCEAAADKTGRRAGDVLVEMGLMQEAEKVYYVAQQVKAIAYSLFAWEEGRYRLTFTDRAAREATKIDLHPAHLIARGVKKLYRAERLARLLAAEDRLIPTQQPAYGLHEVELERWEAELLPRVDGTRTIAQLVALAKKPEAVVRASLWALVALSILEKRV